MDLFGALKLAGFLLQTAKDQQSVEFLFEA
jgi:hypothetical protein